MLRCLRLGMSILCLGFYLETSVLLSLQLFPLLLLSLFLLLLLFLFNREL